MIISHKYKFIFLKTSKTAGTSIEIALSGICGDDDVITPISPRDERIRQSLGYRGAQNYQHKRSRIPFLGRKEATFYNHMPACEVIAQVGEETWNNYFTFCFERNPWDRLLSYYFHLNKDGVEQSISDFLHSEKPDKMHKDGYGVYTIDDKVVVDRVCHYENLEQELKEVGEYLGFPHPLELPNAKTGFRKDRRHYSEILSEAERQLIREKFGKEIALWDY